MSLSRLESGCVGRDVGANQCCYRALISAREPYCPANLSGPVLFCIDSYDSESRLIFQHFSRSTRFTFLCTVGIPSGKKPGKTTQKMIPRKLEKSENDETRETAEKINRSKTIIKRVRRKRSRCRITYELGTHSSERRLRHRRQRKHPRDTSRGGGSSEVQGHRTKTKYKRRNFSKTQFHCNFTPRRCKAVAKSWGRPTK